MLSCKSAKFSIPEKVTYLNCAYMSPMLKSTEKAGIRGLRQKRNPGDIAPADFFTTPALVREEFAKLVNAGDPKRIAIIPSVSYGMAIVARNLKLKSGDTLIVAAEQFPSNYYPWEALCQETGAAVKAIAPEKSLVDRGKTWNEKVLDAIDRSTRVVAIAHTHWADGTKFDLAAIRRRTREVNALLVIDGTQSVGALPFDIKTYQPDALICAGYKWLLGPYSIGMAYFGEFFDNGKPVEENWINRLNSEDFNSLVIYQSQYQEGSRRYSMGEQSNFILLPMLLDSLKQLNRWTPSAIQEYCQSITERPVQKLLEKGFWVESSPHRAHHLLGVRPPAGSDTAALKQKLSRNKIFVSFRGDSIRVSPNVYNDENDLNRLVRVLTGKS